MHDGERVSFSVINGASRFALIAVALFREQVRFREVLMRRREVIALLGCVAGWPLAARAQQVEKVGRIGFMRVGSPPASFIDGFGKD